MFQHLRITHTDDTVVDVHGRRADIIRFERHFKIPAGKMFDGEGMFVEHLWFYGYAAESRDNAELGDFDAWFETVESVEIVTDDDEVDDGESPTDPSPSPSA